MLQWEGRDIPGTLPEIVDPKHTVVIMHDIQNDNTGPGGVFEKDGRRIDVTHLIAPIARFLDEARSHHVRVMYTEYTNLPDFQTFTDRGSPACIGSWPIRYGGRVSARRSRARGDARPSTSSSRAPARSSSASSASTPSSAR